MTKNLDMFRDDDVWEDAFMADVMAAGGFKVIGNLLWPDMRVQDAGKKLKRFTIEGRRERLKHQEEAKIIREAARHGSRLLVEYYAKLSSARVIPVAPEDSKQQVNEDFERIKTVILPLAERIIEIDRGAGYTFNKDQQP